jgi:hypothetical protein
MDCPLAALRRRDHAEDGPGAVERPEEATVNGVFDASG